jgi:hypothetical protein
MAKKIQLTSIEMTGKAEIIKVNSYLIAKCVRAQVVLNRELENAKHNRTERDEESGKWKDVLDKNGNPVVEYNGVSGRLMHDEVMPLLDELVKALEENEESDE